METFGCIGTGNMGGALAEALCATIDPQDLYLTNRTMAKAEILAERLGAHTVTAAEIAQNCDYILLGVKPHLMAGMLADIAPVLAQRTKPAVLVSMAASLTLETLDSMSGGQGYPIIRTMPNTPCSIGQGVILYDINAAVTQEQLAVFCNAFQKAGLLSPLAESLIDAGAAVAGCGPAFVDLFIEALADGGVTCGLPRQQAMDLACAMVAGSANLVAQSGRHPGALKDAVCSPGGSTICGVRSLEQGAFRGTVMDAVIAAYDKMKG